MTETTGTQQSEQIKQLAELILEHTKARLAADYSQAQADAETVQVHPRKLYTLIDRGPAHNMSGMLMIEHATGNIYGIKAYGKVHRGHCFGTLATIADWYWGDYYPEQMEYAVFESGTDDQLSEKMTRQQARNWARDAGRDPANVDRVLAIRLA